MLLLLILLATQSNSPDSFLVFAACVNELTLNIILIGFSWYCLKFMCERGWCSTPPIAARSSPLWNINYSNVKNPRYPSNGAQIQWGNAFPDQAVWSSAALIYLWYLALAVTHSAAHGTVTVSSPYRWWSVDWRLHRHRSSAPPHCCCDGLFLFCFSRSPPIVHIAWNPWVSLVKFTLLRNGIRKQSIIFWPSTPTTPLFLFPPHLTQFGGDYVF